MDTKMIIHPGEILKEEFMVPHGITANRLAIALGIPPNRITLIINGERSITAETAILLGRAFDTTAEFWLNLQAGFELAKARTRRFSNVRIAGADCLAREICHA